MGLKPRRVVLAPKAAVVCSTGPREVHCLLPHRKDVAVFYTSILLSDAGANLSQLNFSMNWSM